MKAKVTFNSTEFGKQAGDLVGRLVRAQQEAVNATGKRVIDGLRVVMDEKIDSPVRFTLNAFSLFKARGRHTDAAIAIKARFFARVDARASSVDAARAAAPSVRIRCASSSPSMRDEEGGCWAVIGFLRRYTMPDSIVAVRARRRRRRRP